MGPSSCVRACGTELVLWHALATSQQQAQQQTRTGTHCDRLPWSFVNVEIGRPRRCVRLLGQYAMGFDDLRICRIQCSFQFHARCCVGFPSLSNRRDEIGLRVSYNQPP
jgi:hypothetical protein